MNTFHWSVDIRGTLTRAHMYLRYHRGNAADNEIGFGMELMPRTFKAWHHKTMCRLYLTLWFIKVWFDYPYPVRHCIRCNKSNPDPKENCWVGGKLFTQEPVPHIFENRK